MRTIFFFVAEHKFGNGFRKFGLTDAGRPQEQQHAVGRVMIFLERSFIQPQPLGDRTHRVFLPDDAIRQLIFHHRKAVGRIAVDHILRNPRFLRNDVDNMLRFDDQRSGSLISTLTEAVSSQPIALSGRCRLRMYFGDISRAVLIASSEIVTE
jgi:hypothetical protein